MTLTHSWI